MSEPRNLLDDLFSKDEQEVETFVDTIKKLDIVIDPETSSRLTSGRPDPVILPELIDQTSGFVRINHGWHDQDYVWHIGPSRLNRPWKVSIERVIWAIVQHLNEVIPKQIIVKVFPPKAEWEIPETSFKAFDLKDVWSINDKVLDALNQRLFNTLNSLL